MTDYILMKGEEVGIPSPSSQLKRVKGGVFPSCYSSCLMFPPRCLNNFGKGCHPEAPQEEPRPKVGPRHSQELEKSRARVSFCFAVLVLLSCLAWVVRFPPCLPALGMLRVLGYSRRATARPWRHLEEGVKQAQVIRYTASCERVREKENICAYVICICVVDGKGSARANGTRA